MPRRVEKSHRSDPTTYSVQGDPSFRSFTNREDAEKRAKFLDGLDRQERQTNR